jgi:hypothetical protein
LHGNGKKRILLIRVNEFKLFLIQDFNYLGKKIFQKKLIFVYR